jgi:hypothetical protein
MAYTGWLSGQKVTSGGLLAMVGLWTPYTVAWTAATTNPGLGNGTITGRYQLVGQTCHFTIELTIGSTTNPGSGTYSLSLPFTAAATGSRIVSGQALSSSVRVDCTVPISPGGSSVQIFAPSASGSTATASLSNTGVYGSNPWVAGNFIRITGTYEIA